nr:C40 family peptidase [Streptacidiphilus neutrinimicus]
MLALSVNSANDAQLASCSSTQAVDESAVASEVKRILAGASAGSATSVPGLDAPSVQIPLAEQIEATGMAMKVPAYGQTIALATALQESGLRNLAGGDRDSLGLFQQRPSQGWGTPAQIMDPVYASTSFYTHLLKVAGWQQLTLTEAAQAVQHSAYPDAYAKWQALAAALQQALAAALRSPTTAPSPSAPPGATLSSAPSAPAASSPSPSAGCGDNTVWTGTIPPGSVPSGYQVPSSAPAAVQTAIRWAMQQLGTTYQWGGSCLNSHGSDPMGHCDCSSLVQRAYAAAGITLGRTTYDQVTEGRPVSIDQLAPGDLVFTEGSAAAPGHVGMYVGDGLIINAPHSLAVVDFNTLADWRPLILAARRIVN